MQQSKWELIPETISWDKRAVTLEGTEADTWLSIYSLVLGLGRPGKLAEHITQGHPI